ncbi:hypothetical protein [Nautilia profundicola]|uniref:hypothetical protein n=1 Tax=Nautilia profundicola TaxID=244787 RepID=UPI00118041C0|nr:hypothetical protein [Nautilia profundicola]
MKIGNSVLADLNVSTNNYKITPAVLAENNTTIASYIGAMLHGIAGCDLASDVCDFSSITTVDINTSTNLPIITELKTILEQNSSASISVTVNDSTMQISEVNATLYATENPSMTGTTAYSFNGAASAGDYASFTYNSENNTISYQISGNVYGNVSGTREIENLYGNVFFKDKNDDDIFYFFSGSLGVAVIPVSDTNTSFVVGLQQPDKNITAEDLNLIVNKKYNYIEFDTDESIYFSIIEINSTNTADLNGTWADYVDQSYGTWEVNGSHLDVFDARGGKIANVIIRAGTSRAGIVVDNVDGGFGVGVEAKALTDADLKGTYYYNDSGSDYECYGTVTVEGTTFKYKDEWCSDNDPESGSGTLVLNPTIDPDQNASTDNNITLNGLAQVKDENGNLTDEFVFLDPDSGYYISVNIDDGELSIGSNKPLK